MVSLLADGGRDFLLRYSWLIFALAAAVVFSIGAYLAFWQYELWQSDPLTRFLLPPYQDINYFIFYSFSRFFAPYLTSLLAALAVLASASLLNRKSGGVFFEKGEPYLAALSVFLVGHPGWLIYLALLIAAYLILHTLYVIRRHESARLPLYHLWAPVAFFVILLNEYWLSHTSWWALLTI